jgi:hypothetical protein
VSTIVVATAEPQGAYHLHALSAALGASPLEFLYLSPDRDLNIGESPIPTTDDVTAIRSATRLILTGGTYTPWTASLHTLAERHGIEVRYSELAFLDPEAERGPHTPHRSSAVCTTSATVLAEYLGVPRRSVVLTGNPLVPPLSAANRALNRVLCVSTVDAETRDPDLHLRTAALSMQANGYEVLVRLHPRENPAPWAGFDLDNSPIVTSSAAEAAVVVAYPGTPLQAIAQIGAPLVVLAPTTELQATATLTACGLEAPWATTAAQATALAEHCMATGGQRPAEPPRADQRIDGAQNLVRFWTEP